MAQAQDRIKILFIVETVTLAHIIRSLTLAQSLNPDKFEIHFAAQEVPKFVEPEIQAFHFWPLKTSVPSAHFLKCLAKGTLPFHLKLLKAQVEEDCYLMKTIRPHIVCGDFRLSLAISSKIQKVKYVNISNLTWDPSAIQDSIVPEIPLVKIFGTYLGNIIFRFAKPIFYKIFARPFNQLAKQFKQEKFGSLLDVYTSGDLTLFLDLPSLVTSKKDLSSQCIGPVMASTPNIKHPKLDLIKQDKPWIIVSLGSSGPQECLPAVLSALRQVDAYVIVAAGEAKNDIPPAAKQFIFDYLPLESIVPKAALVICQGGSPTGYMALKSGIPFLAIPSNLDQFQFAQAIVKKGAALMVRPSELSEQIVYLKATQLLESKNYREQAGLLKKEISVYEKNDLFSEKLLKLQSQRSA